MTLFKKILLVVIAAFALILTFSYFVFKDEVPMPDAGYANEHMITVAGHQLAVEIADTPAKQSLGLSGRTSMDQNKGMLFVFDLISRPGFWMKDMHFPLDFIWIDQDGTIVDITKNISPNTYPEVFVPSSEILYVVEVNAGWVDRNNIRVGDKAYLGL